MTIASVVSALAALGALWFARDTVQETRKLRREERLAHLPELIGEVAEAAMEITQGRTIVRETSLPIARVRLQAAINASGEELEACNEFVLSNFTSGEMTYQEIRTAMNFAMAEVSFKLLGEPFGEAELSQKA